MKTMVSLRILILVLVCVIGLAPSIASSEEFGGFGIVVAQIYDTESPNNMGGIVVLHVFQDSEAQKAGMRAGDIMLEIDAKHTEGRTFSDIVLNGLRGEVGSSANLKIKRVHEDKILSFIVKRALLNSSPEATK